MLPPSMARDYILHRPPSAAPASGIDYAAALNGEQHAAVTSPPGHALVIAGAGSGKTRTLTYRVAWLLDHGTEARNILLLTFTNKAAREMIGRVRELCTQDASDLWAGTFHSIGNRILRRHAEMLGFTRSFSILDSDDRKTMLSAVIAAQDIDTKFKRFPKADVIGAMFSLVENTGASLEAVLEARYDYFLEWLDEIEKVREDFTLRKLETNSMDFDDLLTLTVRLLDKSAETRALYQKKFRHILVDEYQDTNALQGRMIDLLAGPSNSLMAVGDDAQSIYSWRGADMAHILGFPQRYPDARVFTIETNYRSVPEILDLSNAAIRVNRGRFEKDLRSSREGTGARPALVAVEEPGTQAAFVGQRVADLIDQGTPLSEIAVLYRAHFQSLEIQMELTGRGIPFQITSGLRFFEQAHIKDVTAFLRFVTNRRDEVSFKRMVNLMPGCGPGTAEKLWRAWMAGGLAADEAPPASWPQALGKFPVPKKTAPHWLQLCHTLDELTPDGGFAQPASMMFSVLEGVYDEYLKAAFDNYENRRSDIEQVMEYSTRFEDPLEFLAQMSLMSSADGEPGGRRREEEDGDKVTLTSIHQAKGLEWSSVFLIWLVDGQFPNSRVIDGEDLDLMEEERRLFYVALTRAKDDLYLIYPMMNPRSYTGDVICRPSRFLGDFPPDMVEEWRIGSGRESDGDDPF